ncbi:redox-active protein, C_GCAxxG_C_C family, putative [Citrifermentans bemidjiense Bem]|uniref:Redox-active protein, C_GCAxxG_C_C family, putative n=1 Tax=Citrifermentans bemidjiense (strain ATCC BAA-1014 / DSM 16622 / JCM 12645 / Bem) TaxID=404380 RepID=B5EEQ6_CITBB|nr:C-GCAxxG-C-C family protein [Citrifermentans bemidjiense]ACH40842.1 redox-active protein, C_GCAxxG_C_C family, putative [Citrifermentans bemidjiense Bem]
MLQNTAGKIDQTVAGKVATDAEGLYRSGKMHCAEAVLAAVKNQFLPEAGDELLRLAAGFGAGSRSGCICGAVAGGTMGLGLVLDGDRRTTAEVTHELHRWFKAQYGATCCKVLSAKGKSGCPGITASVAAAVAQLLERRTCA